MPYLIVSTVTKPYPSIRWIHPLKQKAIEELIEYVEQKFPSIYRIAVFGSTVDGRCTVYSDIDIVIWGDTEKKYFSPDNDVYDVLWAEDYDPEESIWQSVIEEGLIVYDTTVSAGSEILKECQRDISAVASLPMNNSDTSWPMRTAKKEYLSVNHIHPLKQGKVEELIEYTRRNHPQVTLIAIFGSVVSHRCRPWSDIDIVIYGDVDKKFIPPDNDVYDVLRAEELPHDSRLYKQILKEAWVVYEKGPIESGC